MRVCTLRGMVSVLEERLDVVTQYQSTMPLGDQRLDFNQLLMILSEAQILTQLTDAWFLTAARKAGVVFVVGRLLKVPRGFSEIEESTVDTKVEKD